MSQEQLAHFPPPNEHLLPESVDAAHSLLAMSEQPTVAETDNPMAELAALREQLAQSEQARETAETARDEAETNVSELRRRMAEEQENLYRFEMAVMDDLDAADQRLQASEQSHQETKAQLGAHVEQLQTTNKDLRVAAEQNPLTKLPNRAAFNAAEARTDHPPREFVLFDGDAFGNINKTDEFSYPEGDNKIRRIAKAIERAAHEFEVSTREGVFHWGGDEFCVIAPTKEVEFFVRNAAGEMISAGTMSTGNAILRRAVALYKYHHYVGTKDGERIDFINSLSGAVGDTFLKAAELSQAAKKARKEQAANELAKSSSNSMASPILEIEDKSGSEPPS